MKNIAYQNPNLNKSQADWIWKRAAQRLQFRDPAPFLVELRKFEQLVTVTATSKKVKNLRTNSLKEWRELREAAIFCYGMSQRIGQTVYFARGESQDYDFVASWITESVKHFARVQLKEVVPQELNAKASIEATIATLGKYANSKELTVAIHLNRQMRFEPSAILAPRLYIAALWVFGAIKSDQSEWALWGNFLKNPGGTRFGYPA